MRAIFKRLKNDKSLRAGFTLAEVLIVIAIMAILASFGFVAVNQYNKRLTLLEMDDTAKKIFLAAQNHLTISDTSGTWKQLVVKLEDEDFKMGVPCPFDNRYKVIYGGKDASGNKADVNETLNLILPLNAVNLAGDGSYAIVYDKDTAAIYGVYYSASSTFGNGQNDSFCGTVLDDLGKGEGTDNLRNSKEQRKKQTPLIGYYGNATGTSKIPDTKLDALEKVKVWFTNKPDALTLHIYDPNHLTFENSDNENLEITITGERSRESITYSVKGPEDSGKKRFVFSKESSENKLFLNPPKSAEDSEGYTIIFDSLAGKHFQHLLPTFYPGENITAQVILTRGNETTGKEIVTGAATDNSLYEQIYQTTANDADGKYAARVTYLRHLENLSTDISGITTKSANGSDSKAFSVQKGILTNTIDLKDSMFIGIVPDTALEEFDGNGKSILNMSSTAPAGKGGNGLFADVERTSAQPGFEIKNLTMESPVVTNGGEVASGVLIGDFKGDGLSIKNITINGNVTVEAGQQAGGIIGLAETENAVELSNVHVTAKEKETIGQHVSIKSTGTTAGGIAGSIKAKGLFMNDVIMKPDTTDMMKAVAVSTNSGYVQVMSTGSSSAHTGGLIGSLDLSGSTGSADGKSTIVSSYVLGGHNGFVAAISDGNAGGLIGTIVNGNGLNISESFSTTYVQAAGAHNAGGLIGEISGGSITMKSCYVGGRTKAANVIGTDGNASMQPCYIHDTTAVAESGITVDHEGRYNVMALGTSGGNAGGFIGVLSNGSTLNITDAYTTASTYAAGNCNAGGFIGTITGSTMATSGCYAAGFTYKSSDTSSTAKSGSFVGNLDSATHLTASSTSSKNYVVDGLFVKDGTTDIDNVHTTGVDASSTVVSLVENEKENTPFSQNQNAVAIPYDGSLFGKTYPWKTVLETTFRNTNGNEINIKHCGDWIIPKVVKSNHEVVNKNRLYVEYDFDFIPNHTYYWTLRIRGKLSNQVKYVEMIFSTDDTDVISVTDQSNPLFKKRQRVVFGDQFESSNPNSDAPKSLVNNITRDWHDIWYKEKNYITHYNKRDTDTGKLISRFYIDDVSKPYGNFYCFFDHFYPGEDLVVEAIKDIKDPALTENQKDQTYILQEVNSLYDSIVENGDGSYTAYISNTRHLLNLDKSIYVGNSSNLIDYNSWPKITRAVQISDIMWTRDSHDDTKTQTLELKADPYLEETGQNKDLLNIYNQTANDGVKTYAGYAVIAKDNSTNQEFYDVMPGVELRDTVKEYDGEYNGKRHTLENYCIYGNLNGLSGLFSKIDRDFYAHNIILRDFYSGKSKGNGIGLLCSKIGNDYNTDINCTIEKVSITGTCTVNYESGAMGAFIGSIGKGYTKFISCDISGDLTLDGAGDIGGFVGNSSGDLDIEKSTIDIQNIDLYSDANNGSVGGFVGNKTTGRLSIKGSKFKAEKADIKSIASSGTGAGGFVGLLQGSKADFENCSLSGTDISISTNGANYENSPSAGGYIGHNLSEALTMKSTDISGANIKVTAKSTSWGSAAGGLIGDTPKDVIISNSSMTCSHLYVLSGIDAGGFIGNATGKTTISASSIISNNGNIVTDRLLVDDNTSGNAGGAIGSAAGISIDSVRVYGSRMIVLNDGKSYAAGGFIGKITGGNTLEINNSMSSAYVDARKTQYTGGFIGYLDISSSNSPWIANSYASGRTDNKIYRVRYLTSTNNIESNNVLFDKRNVNIIGGEYTGGFIGFLNNSYKWIHLHNLFSSCSTSSIYGNTESGNQDYNILSIRGLGGFLGYISSANVTFENCYSVGVVRPNSALVNKDDKGKVTSYTAAYYPIGSFIGKIDGENVYNLNQSSGYIKTSTNNDKGIQGADITGIGTQQSSKFGSFEIERENWNPVENNVQTETCDSYLSGMYYPYRIWTTNNGLLFYFGDWDQLHYEDPQSTPGSITEDQNSNSSGKSSSETNTDDSSNNNSGTTETSVSSESNDLVNANTLNTYATTPEIVKKKTIIR